MDWVHDIEPSMKLKGSQAGTMRMLEVGALSIENCCSRSPNIEITRIDLHSQHPDILSQDFMIMPLPANENEKFQMISLSLVLNYVPTPPARGEMLRRTTAFLQRSDRNKHQDTSSNLFFPSLFLVLPAPCVTNSRYLNESRLTEIMESLGYFQIRRKISAKLVYYLWLFRGDFKKRQFNKEELSPGKKRNNFAIVLE